MKNIRNDRNSNGSAFDVLKKLIIKSVRALFINLQQHILRTAELV